MVVMSEDISILIVDDSSVYRYIIKSILEKIPGIKEIGMAYNGKIALQKIRHNQPDLVILDLDMPEMNGLETLKNIRILSPKIITVMITSHSSQKHYLSIEALSRGALDIILKPDEIEMSKNIEILTRHLSSIVQIARDKKHIKVLMHGIKTTDKNKEASAFKRRIGQARIDAIAIAISTGGPATLRMLIPKLPDNINVPVFIVQHMPETFTKVLADTLDRESFLNVVEASHGDEVKPNTVYIAPGGRQMKIVRNQETRIPEFYITNDPPENYCRPSADYLFRSLAPVYGGNLLCIIMTGMGEDGVNGSKTLKALNATVFAQDEETSVVFGMPREAIKANVVDKIIPIDKMADEIVNLIRSTGD